MSGPRGWLGDLALGVRLSVGGGRTSMARVVLSAVGIACAVAVLLVAASMGTMYENRQARQAADVGVDAPKEGVHPTWTDRQYTTFRGENVRITYVAGTAPDSPKPAALRRLPQPGEMFASAELAALLRSPDGELLRPRLPEKIIGELPTDLVATPGEYIAWVGAEEQELAPIQTAMEVYGFGAPVPDNTLDPTFMAMLLVGATVLLLPVFIFVTSASRIAGAERDRRLSALRLVGAGSRQVRRIAAGESLVGAFGGLVVGGVAFLVLRQFAEDISLFGERVYVADVVPNPALVLLIILAIPAITVLSALFALRRTIIEPLGVVRQGKPVRRRLWWRLALIVLGVVLMTTQLGAEDNSDLWGWTVAGGAALLLIGVPVLLPWLVERVAGRLSGGPSSWLLAVRRLQLDSGTSARVVGGVAVVLAGAIALQTVLMSVGGRLSLPGVEEQRGTVEAWTTPDLADTVAQDLSAADGVEGVYPVRYTSGYVRGEEDSGFSAAVVNCAGLREVLAVRQCANGDVFLAGDGYNPPPRPGIAIEWREYPHMKTSEWDPNNYTVTGTWTVPDDATTIKRPSNANLYAAILMTPGAVDVATLPPEDSMTVFAQVDKDLTGDQLEGIRNSVAAHRIQTTVYSYNTVPDLTVDQQTYVSIRTGLYAGSIFTLLLAGISLLVLALEHIRERRRPLAVLAASGVPRGVLGRSLLWQVALPIALGTVVALGTGVGLATLVLRATDEHLTVDWGGVALLCGGAIALSLLVSAMTLPFLRNATRLTTLRTE